MKKLLTVLFLTILTCVGYADTNVVTTPPVGVGKGLLQLGGAILNATPTNLALAPYATYVSKPKKWGYGLLLAYNFNNYVGVITGVDHVDQFLAVSGGIQLSYPVHPFASLGLPNVELRPFAGTELGTALQGTGVNNGGIQTINFAGAAIDFGHVLSGHFFIAGAGGTRTGAGSFSGLYCYGSAGWSKGF